MIDIKLPFWLGGTELTKLAAAAKSYWEKVEGWLGWHLEQRDPDTCTEGVLELLAFERDIERIKDEPLSLFRLRVKYALVNAQDAGSVAGIKRIFVRLGIGAVDVIERAPGKDWDVIQLQLTDQQLSSNQALLQRLLEQYGRTCRRYEFNLITPVDLGVAAKEFDHAWFYDRAS